MPSGHRNPDPTSAALTTIRAFTTFGHKGLTAIAP
jgi:hypothetical protein